MRGILMTTENKDPKQAVKDFIIKSLEQRMGRLLSGKLHNIPMAKKNIEAWQRELDSKQEFSGSGLIRMKIYEDTNLKLIKQEKEWLIKAEKTVQDCLEAIDYMKKQ